MSGLLDRADNTTSRHEFLSSSEFGYVSYYSPSHPSLRRDIGVRLRSAERDTGDRAVFVDVNCKLSFALEPLRQARPGVKIFHLVRDGRAVVASNWVRKMYTPYSKGISFIPDTEKELAAWDRYDRFQRLAWQWNHIVRHLLANGLPIVKLERAIADYDYLESSLLGPAGIGLRRAAWDEVRKQRANETRFKLGDLLRGRPLKLEWTNARRAQFDEICGDTMRALGYSETVENPMRERGTAPGYA